MRLRRPDLFRPGGPDRPDARAEMFVGAAFIVSFVTGVALLVVYVAGGQTQIEGVLLMLALGGIGTGVIVWGHDLIPDVEEAEPRGTLESPAPRDAESARIVREGITRRHALLGLLGTGFAGLAAALAIPVFSLGPAPGRSLFETPWRRGLRLVGLDNQPVHADQIPVGGILTVFPEGAPGSADGQAVLIRVDPALLELPDGRDAGAPNGYVCYSKKCTHAGCPVGLYRASDHSLVCPCHQSTFDVLRGAVPVFGPAVRPLPQLPIQQQPDGTFVATDGFPAPVGPSFWDIHSEAG
jgi:ubiquinol-cytochrome c reductase iron-sulfur subunit